MECFDGHTLIVTGGARGMPESDARTVADVGATVTCEMLEDEGRPRAGARSAKERRVMDITTRLAACLAALTAMAVPAMSASPATAATFRAGAGTLRCPPNYTGPTNPATGCPLQVMI